MQRTLWISLSVLFVAVLLSFTVTYTVKFTEKAVLTTFGKAGPEAIKTDAGLHFKLPYPIQSVTTYDTRLRFTPSRTQTQVTKDERQIIVEAYCTWRVANPLLFFQRFSNAGVNAEEHFRKADDEIKSSLTSALAELGKYRMDELFNKEAKASRLAELESSVRDALSKTSQSGLSLASYGIEASDVGISKIILPEKTSQAVNERMIANRDRVAQEITSRAEAEEKSIKAMADAEASKIRDFARRYAEQEKTKGDLEAAVYIGQMNVNADLAVFLRNMDMLRESITKQATLVVPFSAGGMGAFDPGYLNSIKAGEIPSSNLPAWASKPPLAPKAEGAK